MRRNPFDDLEELFERMEAQIESGVGFGRGSLPVDVLDLDGEYEVTAGLPGFSGEDVDLTYTDGRLRIRAEKEAVEESEDRYLRKERPTGSVNRTVRLPEPVLQEEIRASLDEGILTVTLPKEAEEEEGKQIEIE